LRSVHRVLYIAESYDISIIKNHIEKCADEVKCKCS